VTILALGILIRNSKLISYFFPTCLPVLNGLWQKLLIQWTFVEFCKLWNWQLLKSQDVHFISIFLRHLINSHTVVDPPRHSYTQTRASVYMYRYSCDRGQRRDHPSLMHPAPKTILLNKQCRKRCWYINGICWRRLRLGKIWI
jgi:hypothetical protein